MISFLIRTICSVYSLVVAADLIVKLIRIPSNKWTELLNSIVEPALEVTRKLMERVVPALKKGGFDWSPVVLIVLLQILRILI